MKRVSFVNFLKDTSYIFKKKNNKKKPFLKESTIIKKQKKSTNLNNKYQGVGFRKRQESLMDKIINCYQYQLEVERESRKKEVAYQYRIPIYSSKSKHLLISK